MLALSHKNVQRSIQRFLVCAFMLTGMAFAAPGARAAEIIPSMGWSRTPESSDEAKISYGLALRAPIAPFVAVEFGGSYRKEMMFNGMVEATQWPITGSVWLTPMPSLYVGGGMGWYSTTFHYPNTPLLASVIQQDFGLHLGGGLTLPLVPRVASLDLNGRFVYLGKQETALPPNSFDADYWTTSLGVAFHF